MGAALVKALKFPIPVFTLYKLYQGQTTGEFFQHCQLNFVGTRWAVGPDVFTTTDTDTLSHSHDFTRYKKMALKYCEVAKIQLLARYAHAREVVFSHVAIFNVVSHHHLN